jgi:hypothetical protein
MKNGEGTSSVIHFLDKESMQSKELDSLFEKMAMKFTHAIFSEWMVSAHSLFLQS